jgi:hypothetical protein
MAAKIPSVRASLIAIWTAAALGFLALDNYVARFGPIWNAMHGQIAVGAWLIEYRWVLVLCVLLTAARLFVSAPGSMS